LLGHKFFVYTRLGNEQDQDGAGEHTSVGMLHGWADALLLSVFGLIKGAPRTGKERAPWSSQQWSGAFVFWKRQNDKLKAGLNLPG
jgi:hypothetical protein